MAYSWHIYGTNRLGNHGRIIPDESSDLSFYALKGGLPRVFINHNANPEKKHVGDCTVRAISVALDKSWEEVFIGMCLYGFMEADMPSANHVWGRYLKRNGYRRYNIDDHEKERYTVADFCRDNPKGTYVLALSSHVIAVINGNYYDTWDSGAEVPIYYWKHEG